MRGSLEYGKVSGKFSIYQCLNCEKHYKIKFGKKLKENIFKLMKT